MDTYGMTPLHRMASNNLPVGVGHLVVLKVQRGKIDREVVDVMGNQETPNFWTVQFEFLHSGEGTVGSRSRSQQPGTGETVQQ